jgi:hypothetical protein
MKLRYIDIATKKKCRMKQGKKIKTCCHHGNKRNYVWNSSYTSKAEKNCYAITKMAM